MSGREESADLQRVEQVFHELCDIEPAERRQRLEEIAKKEPVFARTLTSLLAAHERPALIDETPVTPFAHGTDGVQMHAFRAGEAFEGFVLEAPIGRGGMGVVWRARQLSPKRRVALKVLRSGPAADAAQRRFAREADIMGALQHPGIARVFEAGSVDGPDGSVPYYAMELIEGLPLDQYANARGLGTRRRLELVIAVCDAVAHAHARDVIHRDLKPANILVTDDGHPKVLDFGVARAASLLATLDTVLTNTGQLVGTIAYMSPEQAMGNSEDVDQRSDVYSLGVVLYELISGRRPLQLAGRSTLEALELIRTKEPASLGSIDASWRGDLSVICAKALAKEPVRRYASAVALADDLRSFLGERPIKARPNGLGYRLKKYVRRHRLTVIAAGIVLLSLVAGLLLALEGKREAEQSATRAETAAREAESALKLYQGVLGFLDDTLAAVDPSLSGRQFVTLEAFVDEIAKGLDARFTEDPESKAMLETTVGRAYSGIERFDDSRKHLLASLEARRSFLEADDPLVIEVLYQLAFNEAKARELDEARAYIREALALVDRVASRDDAQRIRSHELAGFIEFLASDFDAAQSYLRSGKSSDGKSSWFGAWTEAKIDIVQGRLDEGIEKMSLVAKRAARNFGADHPRVIAVTFEIAESHLAAERLTEAETFARKAMSMVESRFGGPRKVIFRSHGILGRILMEMGRLPEAEKELRGILDRQAELDHPESFKTSTQLTLGSVLMRTRRHEESRKLIEEATATLRENYPDGHHILASALLLASQDAMARRQPKEARDLAVEAWEMAKVYPVADIDLRTGAHLARIHRAFSDFAKAISVITEVADLADGRHGVQSEIAMPYRVLLGSFLFDDGQMKPAVEALKVVEDLAALKSPKHGFTVTLGRRSLGGALLKLGDRKRAETTLRQAFETSMALGPRGRGMAMSVGQLLIQLYEETGDEAQKQTIRRRLGE